MRHPAHDAIARSVAGWYRESSPELGYVAERRAYGWVQRHPALAGAAVTLAPCAPEDVADHLAALRADLGGTPASLRVEGRDTDARLRPALEAAGCHAGTAESFLVFVGDLPSASPSEHVAIEAVDESGLEAWARTKVAGFAGVEPAAVGAAELRAERRIRAAELRGGLRLRLARVDGEPAGAIAAYTRGHPGGDWLVFSLATLPAFREAGVARLLLVDALDAARAAGARSTLINADPDDWPHGWYVRLGFEDEVYWRRSYAVANGESWGGMSPVLPSASTSTRPSAGASPSP